MTNYLLYDSYGTIIGNGITPDGTIPKNGIECSPAQASAWQSLAVSNGEIVPASTAVLLSQAQAAQIGALTSACQAQILAGYTSSALGAAHTYPSTPTDQMNMNVAVTASLLPGIPSTWTTPFWCADSTGAWAMVEHTAAQIQQAGSDGKAAIQAARVKLATLAAQVQAATTVSAVQAITW